MTRPYADAEVVDLLRTEVHDGFKELQAQLKEVINQTRETNGRVKSLELWKAWILGALAAISTILGIPTVIVGIFGLLNR